MKNLKKPQWIDPLFTLSASPSVENLKILEQLPAVKIGLAGAFNKVHFKPGSLRNERNQYRTIEHARNHRDFEVKTSSQEYGNYIRNKFDNINI